MNQQILVSIIIPLYNAALLIKRCLDSVYDQKGNHNLEVIVIDDGSTDNSIEIVRTYKYPILLLKQSNQGSAAARNRGIEAATGKYMAFLDADDYWLQGFLHETVEFLEKNREAIAVNVGQIHKIIGKPEAIAPEILKSPLNIIKEPFVLPDFFDFWAIHNHVCTGSVLMRAEIAKKAGGQRVDLRITQDLEYWAYLATIGKWGFIPKVLFVSDGGLIVKKLGWGKYKTRFQNIPDFNIWFSRIKGRMSAKQLEAASPMFDRIVEGLSRAMLTNGEILRARRNILNSHSNLAESNNIHVRIAQNNWFSWVIFGFVYRLYQHLKIRIISKLVD